MSITPAQLTKIDQQVRAAKTEINISVCRATGRLARNHPEVFSIWPRYTFNNEVKLLYPHVISDKVFRFIITDGSMNLKWDTITGWTRPGKIAMFLRSVAYQFIAPL